MLPGANTQFKTSDQMIHFHPFVSLLNVAVHSLEVHQVTQEVHDRTHSELISLSYQVRPVVLERSGLALVLIQT